jgi:hypothetical protein
MAMTIGHIARRARLRVSTIRYYERLALVLRRFLSPDNGDTTKPCCTRLRSSDSRNMSGSIWTRSHSGSRKLSSLFCSWFARCLCEHDSGCGTSIIRLR